jgi:hypothetical protein
LPFGQKAGNLFNPLDCYKKLENDNPLIFIKNKTRKPALSYFLENPENRLWRFSTETMEYQYVIRGNLWHQSCLECKRETIELGSNVSRCDGTIIWLGQTGRDSGGGAGAPHPDHTYSGRPQVNHRAAFGRAGGHGGFSQPARRDRPLGRMAGHPEKTGGRGKP